jgi:hypothetical protein
MDLRERGRTSGVIAAQMLARRQWAEATLRQHRETAGVCAVCTSGDLSDVWPYGPARTALVHLGGVGQRTARD